MEQPIILVGGGTGVGTSRLSFELASYLGINSVTSTDAIREVVRTVIHHAINPALQGSTYLAGKTEHYAEKTAGVQRAEILRGYKNQCSAVWVGIEGLLERGFKESIPLVIEGIHLRSGFVSETRHYQSFKDRLLEYAIFISDEEVHRQRFLARQEEAPGRPMEKYTSNFREIRWIHDYLVDRAKRFPSIVLIDNVGSVEETKRKVVRAYYERFPHS